MDVDDAFLSDSTAYNLLAIFNFISIKGALERVFLFTASGAISHCKYSVC